MTFSRDLSQPRYEGVREWSGESPQLTVRAQVQDAGRGLALQVDTTAGGEMIRVEQVDFVGATGGVVSFFPQGEEPEILPGGVVHLSFVSTGEIPPVVTSAMLHVSYTDRPLVPLFPVE